MKRLLAILVMALSIVQAQAKEAYGVLVDSTLTIYYDDLRSSREGETFDMYKNSNATGWFNTEKGKEVVTAFIDASFSEYTAYILDYLFGGCENLKEIKGIENINFNNVESLRSMFSDCKSLTSLDLGNFNTSHVKGMNRMFNGCSGLTSLNISNFNTSNVKDMGYMFSGCSGLTSLNVSNFNTSNVTEMRGMFSGCSGLTSLNISNFNTSNVKDMGYMFSGCSNLTSLDLSHFETNNVTTMDAMFYDCKSLTSLDLGNFNTSYVKGMSGMFRGCSGLIHLDVSNFNTSNVTSMDTMFSGCSGLTSLNISNFNTSNVKDMGYMFSGCSNLTSLDLSHFETNNVTTMDAMFYHCKSLTSLDLGNFNTNYVTNIRSMFNGCAGLETLVLGKDFNKIPSYWSECVKLRKIELLSEIPADVEPGTFEDIIKQYVKLVVPTGTEQLYRTKTEWKDFEFISEKGSGKENYTPYVAIANNTMTFYYDDLITEREGTIYLIRPTLNHIYSGCPGTYWNDDNAIKEVTKVKFEQAFSEVHPAYVGVWFYNFINLTTIEGIEYLNTDKATKMTWMFRGCGNLTSLDVSHFDTSNVTDMSSIFGGCSQVGALDVSHFDTSNVTNMSSMFNGCRSVSALDVSNFKTNKVTTMSSMFNNCINVYNLDVSKFNTSNVKNFYCMFSNCSSISSLDVSNFDTSKATNMSGMFADCSDLKAIDITGFSTESVDPNVPIHTNTYLMFSSCGSLKNIVMGDKFNIVGKYTFYNCGNLESVTFSKNVSVIGDYAFYACQNIKTVNSSIETPFAFSSNVFETTVYNNATLNVPNGTKSLYQTTDGWKLFKSIAGNSGGSETQEKEAYAVFNNGMLTLYYDDNRSSRSGTVYNVPNGKCYLPTPFEWILGNVSIGHPWMEKADETNTIVFDPSFVQYTPISTYGWFIHYKATEIQGLEYLNTSKTTDLSYMFAGCKNLSKLDLTNLIIAENAESQHICDFCSGLESISLGESISHLGKMAFRRCSSLHSIVIPKGVTKIDEFIFYEDSNLTTIIVDEGNPNYDSRGGCNAIIKTATNELICGASTTVIPNGIVTIGSGAFSDLTLQEINIPNTVTTIKDYAFYDVRGITEITIPNSVSEIGELALKTDGLVTVNSLIEHPFPIPSNCFSDITKQNGTLNIPYGTMSLYDVCESWNKFVNIVDPSGTKKREMYAYLKDGVLTYCFDCEKANREGEILELYKNGSTGDFGDLRVIIDWNRRDEIKKVVFSPSFVVIKPQSLKGLFRYLTELSEIDGLQYLNTSEVTDMREMFCDCKKLTSIDLSGFNTAIVSNMDNMFKGCSELVKVILGAKFTQLPDRSFADCDKIISFITLMELPFNINSNCFTDNVKNTATLYVPKGSMSLYRIAEGWKEFKNISENVENHIDPIDDNGGTDYGDGEIDENTDLNGNVIGNIYYNISDGNGEYNSAEGCIIIKKPTSDDDMDNLGGQDIFGEDFQNGFTGIVFMVQAGQGTIKVNAESVGSMTLKVKIGNNAPMSFELEGKMKASIPYSVTEPTYVYIYGGETTANARGLRASSSDNALKIYGIEWSNEYSPTAIESIRNDEEIKAVIYNMSGQRIQRPSKGIYIKNGKKVVIK